MSAAQWLRIHATQLAFVGPPSVPSEFPNICQLYPPAAASFSTAFCQVFCVAICSACVCSCV